MLLHIDSFENYGETADSAPSPAGVVACKYPAIYGESGFRVRTGRFGGYSLDIAHYDNYCGLSSLTTNDTVVIGVAIKSAGFSLNYGPVISLYDGTTRGINLFLTSAGEIAVYLGGSLLKTSVGAGLTINNWFFIELKVKCNATTGTYEVRVGGENVCYDTGVNTKAGAHDYHDGFRLSSQYFTGTPHFDDLYFLDGSSAINNTFLGNVRVVTIRPDEATADADFTPDSGANYARMNEAVRGDDANYVESETSTNKDLYGYGALPTLTPIAGVMVCTDCRETDATSFSIKTVCKSGATESADAGQAVGSSNYVTRSRIIELDPNGPATWTKITLDAATFGIEVS
jgi:hypothetical protein